MKVVFLFVLVLFLVQAQFVFSLDCKSISSENKELCESILKLNNLTLEEKSLLINNLDYNDNLHPNHFLVYSHNINLNITSSPEGVNSINKSFIKNAWASIFSVYPSVYYNESLYSSYESQILTGFNYNLEIPKDYSSSSYPSKSNGDCKRIYSIIKNTSSNKVYSDKEYFGEGRIVRIFLENDTKIFSEYSIYLKLNIDHYKWKSHCCKRRDGICVKTCYSCNFKSSEIKEERISILNSLNLKLFANNLSAKINSYKENKNSKEINISYSDDVEITFENSSFKEYRYLFNINSSFYPYNIYTIYAETQSQKELNNLVYQDNILYLKNVNKCNILAFDFFNKISFNCSLNEESINLSIITNKTFYSEGERFDVLIFPKEIEVNISYGEYSSISKNIITLSANKSYNKIIAKYKGEIIQKVIFVFDKSKFVLLFYFVLFFLILFFVYKILEKIWRFK